MILALLSYYFYNKIGDVSFMIFCAMFFILARLEIIRDEIKGKK
jgi:hypothetical protein